MRRKIIKKQWTFTQYYEEIWNALIVYIEM